MQKFIIKKIVLIMLLFLPLKGVFAYQKVSTDEYKEFLRKFLEEKYYLNKDSDSDVDSESGVCDVGTLDIECKGVTVYGYGTYDLETYVAGVLYAEPGSTIEADEELAKAWAVVIRSYTLAHTNNCANGIGSSSYEQNFSQGGVVNTEKYKKYADDTAGIVVADGDQALLAVYALSRASHCISVDGNQCKFRRCTKYAESIESCPGEVTEFIVPRGIVTYEGSTHYGGLEPYIAAYLTSKQKYTYDKIIEAFYGKNNIARIKGASTGSSSISNSCSEDDDMVSEDGVTFPVKNYDNVSGNTSISELQNNQYFANAGSNIGQCPWYAKARALEIVNTSSLSSDLKTKATAVLNQTWGNGVDWYGGVNSTLGSYFAYSNDINKPKAGSIVAWSGGNGHNFGHVGIIEKVNNDGTVVLSDGWNGGGWNAADTWSNVRVHTRTVTIDDLKTYDGVHAFEGYTYLFSYRK